MRVSWASDFNQMVRAINKKLVLALLLQLAALACLLLFVDKLEKGARIQELKLLALAFQTITLCVQVLIAIERKKNTSKKPFLEEGQRQV